MTSLERVQILLDAERKINDRLREELLQSDELKYKLDSENSLLSKNNSDLVCFYRAKEAEWNKVVLMWKEENTRLNDLNVFLKSGNDRLYDEKERLTKNKHMQDREIRKLELVIDDLTLYMTRIRHGFEVAMLKVSCEAREAQDAELERLQRRESELEAAWLAEKAGRAQDAQMIRHDEGRLQDQVDKLKAHVVNKEKRIDDLNGQLSSLEKTLKDKTKQADEFRMQLSNTTKRVSAKTKENERLQNEANDLMDKLKEETQRADKFEASNKANVAAIQFIETRHMKQKGELYERLRENRRTLKDLCCALLPEFSKVPASQDIKLTAEHMHEALTVAQSVKETHVAVKKLQEQVAELTNEKQVEIQKRMLVVEKFNITKQLLDRLRVDNTKLREENNSVKKRFEAHINDAKKVGLTHTVGDVLGDDEDEPLLRSVKDESEKWLGSAKLGQMGL